MDKVLSAIFSASFLFSVIRITTPLMFGAMGALICKQGGVLHIAFEAAMLFAAFFGMAASAFTQSLWLALLCAVLSVCAAGGAEEAAEQLSPDLFNLYEIKDESATWLGTAIPVTNGAVITSCSCLPEDISTLVITDGVGAWDALVCLPDSAGATAVVLFGGEDQSSPTVAPFQFGNDSLAFSAGENYILTGDGLGSRVYRDISTAAEIQWRGQKCLLLGLSDYAQQRG